MKALILLLHASLLLTLLWGLNHPELVTSTSFWLLMLAIGLLVILDNVDTKRISK